MSLVRNKRQFASEIASNCLRTKAPRLNSPWTSLFMDICVAVGPIFRIHLNSGGLVVFRAYMLKPRLQLKDVKSNSLKLEHRFSLRFNMQI